jgi:ankyrin repeat protein
MNKLYDIGGNRLIMHGGGFCGSTALHFAIFDERSDLPILDIVMFLVEKGGQELLMMQNNYGDTVLHYACNHKKLDVVKFLIEKGGQELFMMQSDGRKSTLDWVKNKEGDIYKYLIEARDYPFHAHCSTAFVTASTIQKHIDKDGPECLFQVNGEANMTPMQILSINQSAPRDSINLVIVTMLQERGIHE